MDDPLFTWICNEHRKPEKQRDWFSILAIIVVASAVLAFYFGNNLFGVFILVAGIALGTVHWRKPEELQVSLESRGITMGQYHYPYSSYRSFWIEDDHVHGPRILLHPTSNFLPLVTIPIDHEIDMDDVRDILLVYLHEEYLEESLVHRLFDKLGI